jgi:ATP-dependent Clp protease adapter protein ClpS
MGGTHTREGTSTLHCPLCGTNQLCDECTEICMAIISDNDDRSRRMPTFSPDLDQSLRRAVAIAQERRHQFATEEHLLLALTDDPDAAVVMRACGIDLGQLRSSVSRALSTLDASPLADGAAPQTSPDFRAVVQDAVVHVQSIDSDSAVTGVHILVRLLAAHGTADLLRAQGMTRYDATRYISHGIGKENPASHERGGNGPQSTADKPAGLLGRVKLLNDDYTPMEFVVHILERVFDMDNEAATRIMLHIHHDGVGTCGTYPYDTAGAKVTEVLDLAREHQHPLHCVLERASSA